MSWISGSNLCGSWVVIVGSGSGEWRKSRSLGKGLKKKVLDFLLTIVLNEQGVVDRESFIVREMGTGRGEAKREGGRREGRYSFIILFLLEVGSLSVRI